MDVVSRIIIGIFKGNVAVYTVFVLIRVHLKNNYSPRERLLFEWKKALRPWTAPKLGWCLVNRAVMTMLGLVNDACSCGYVVATTLRPAL